MTTHRINKLVLCCTSLALAVVLADVRPGCSADQAPVKKARENRLGLIVLQFDDGTIGHYTHAFKILEKYRLKGSFGVVTGVFGKPGRLTAEQVVEMHRAGHEIHDHTLLHNAAFWGNPEKKAEWVEEIKQSLGILKKLGIETRGWNQPGGKGQAWTPELRDTLRPYYDYVAGRVALKPDEFCNTHWHLLDDPFCLGYGGVNNWGGNGGKGDNAKELELAKTRMADCIQQGLLVIPLWHVVDDRKQMAWALEETCKFIRANDWPVLRMADAVKAVKDPRAFFGKDVEQMPNPTFACDADQNHRPDGYEKCGYAPPEVKSPTGGPAAEFDNGTTTWIYGPEKGRTQFRLTARSADDTPRKVTPVLVFAEINDKCAYRWREKERRQSMTVGKEWQTCVTSVDVTENVDRVKIEFEITPPGKVYVSGASWRIAP